MPKLSALSRQLSANCVGAVREPPRQALGRQAPQALWSAAACCRFSAASLLARRLLECHASVHGQQAGLKESGSKLPHSKAAAQC